MHEVVSMALRSPNFTQMRLHCNIKRINCFGHKCYSGRSVVRYSSSTALCSVGECVSPRTDGQMADRDVMNRQFTQLIGQNLILAPLTRGNHLAFRRFCAELSCKVTMSEMIICRNLIKGEPRERALLRRSNNEHTYGVQIATNMIEEGIKAGQLAKEQGAEFLDLNCGCPQSFAVKRKLGSNLLKKPAKLGRLVEGIVREIDLPMTVKVRLGTDSSHINVAKVIEALQDTGAAAVTIHGRTALQRYKKPADWEIIEQIARSARIPIIGNGDILSLHDAKQRMANHGCLSVMVGRGALIKPWIFQEFAENRQILPSAEERVVMYRKLVAYMKEHFGSDNKGKQKSMYFLPWHLGFFCRYRPLPDHVFADMSKEIPLISTRWDLVVSELGETMDSIGFLERLLRCEAQEAHQELSDILWDSETDEEAIQKMNDISLAQLVEWEDLCRGQVTRDIESEG